MNNDSKREIIDWITCDGQANGIQEDGELTEELTDIEIEAFIAECHAVLQLHFGIEA